jgi:hypothetical protein
MIERDYSFPSWLIQLVVAFLGPVIILTVIDTWLNVQDTPSSQLFSYLCLGGVGAGMAFLISAVAGESWREGLWVWVLPVTLEVAALIREFSSEGLSATLRTLFYVAGLVGERSRWAWFC